jgi:hypothetical protein
MAVLDALERLYKQSPSRKVSAYTAALIFCLGFMCYFFIVRHMADDDKMIQLLNNQIEYETKEKEFYRNEYRILNNKTNENTELKRLKDSIQTVKNIEKINYGMDKSRR